MVTRFVSNYAFVVKQKVMEMSRECHNHMLQPTLNTKRKNRHPPLSQLATALVQQVFHNINFHIKCVDDLDPITPYNPLEDVQEPLYCGKSPLIVITALPDRGGPVIAADIDVKLRKICLIYVYPPTRCSTEMMLSSKLHLVKSTKYWIRLLPHTRYC